MHEIHLMGNSVSFKQFYNLFNFCDNYRMYIIGLGSRSTHRRTDANLYPLERQLMKASETSFNLEGGAKGQI